MGKNHYDESRGSGRHIKQKEVQPSRAELRRAEREAEKARVKAEKEAEKERARAQKSARAEAEAAEREAVRRAKEENRRREQEGRKGAGAGILVFLILAILLFGGATAAGWYVSSTETNLKNVYVGDLPVSGLTKAETLELLEENHWNAEHSDVLHVTLPGGIRFKLDYLGAGANLSAEALAEAAYAYGHDGGWYGNLATYLKSMAVSYHAEESDSVINTAYVTERISDGIAKYDALMSDTECHIDLVNGSIRILKGAGSVTIDEQDVYSKIVNAMAVGATELDYRFENVTPEEPDFQGLSEELNVEVQDAYFDERFNIIPEVSGVILDPALASSMWQAAEITEYVEIPVELHEPEVVAADLEGLLYRDMLGTTTTSFSGSTENRINNINLAAGSINGTILMPGEVFSYNTTVGERTAEAGYKMAGAYSSGQVVQQLGGGICQVSSTLYKTTLLSQMETVDRTCHQFRVYYLEPSYDATVDWPGVDFQFRNKREYPVKIVAYCDNDKKTVTIEIWGTDVDGSYVELTYGTARVFDEEWRELGYDVVIATSAACNVWVYDKNGNLITDYMENYSYYFMHEEDIKTPDGMTLEEARALKEAEENGGDDPGGDGGDTGGTGNDGGDTGGTGNDGGDTGGTGNDGGDTGGTGNDGGDTGGTGNDGGNSGEIVNEDGTLG